MAQPIVRSTSNEMTKLLNKIERRLGMTVMTLPDNLKKDNWCKIIEEDTLPTYSRYFPYSITILIDNTCFKDGYYFIDKDLPAGSKIIGVKDIDWQLFSRDSRYGGYGVGFPTYDYLGRDYGVDDIALTQVTTDISSLFNLGIYIEFEYPNKVRLVSINGAPISRYRPFPLKIYLEHPSNLMTISPTMMEEFEKLAQSDIAIFLYQNLKYYDNQDNVYTQLDLKLETLQEWANKRDDIVKELDDAHTTTANEYQSLIITV
jgi:hypothetical protein